MMTIKSDVWTIERLMKDPAPKVWVWNGRFWYKTSGKEVKS